MELAIMTDIVPAGAGDTADDIASSIKDLSAEELTKTLHSLADASRQDLSVRQQLAHEDVLKALIARLEASTSNKSHIKLQEQILRCIGNACASNAIAIRTICGIGLEWLQPYYTQEVSDLPGVLRDMIGGTSYNLLAADFTEDGDKPDAENPATEACFNIGMLDWVLRLLASKVNMRLSTEELVDMLFWLSACTSDSFTLSDASITNILTHTCPIAPSWSADTIGTWIEAIVSILRSQATRVRVAADYDVSPLYELLRAVEDHIIACKAHATPEQSEDLSVLVPQSANLTWLLSDISSEPSFAKGSQLDRPLVKACIESLRSQTQPDQLFIATSLVLGNAILNVDEIETTKLIQGGMAGTVVSRVSTGDASSDLLYAGAGLLSNMCRPKSSRDELGATPGLLEVVQRLCKSDTPQLSQAGLRLVRSLGRESPANQARLAFLMEALPKPAQQPAIV